MKLVMDERVKHRLVGLAVIISIGAIFAPAIMKKSNQRFENNVSVSVKLPPKPVLPKVAVPEEQKMFETVKVAHVEIPSVREDFQTVSSIAKAEPLTPVNETREPIAVAKNEPLSLDVAPKQVAKVQPKASIVAINKTVAAKKNRVVAKVEKVKALPKNGYAVQLATFTRQANAVTLINRLKSKGYKASLNKIATREGVIYKVIVGQTAERQKAQLLQKQLASAVQIKGFIVETSGIS